MCSVNCVNIFIVINKFFLGLKYYGKYFVEAIYKLEMTAFGILINNYLKCL